MTHRADPCITKESLCAFLCDGRHSQPQIVLRYCYRWGSAQRTRDPICINHKINRFSEIPSTEGLDKNLA